MSTETHQPRRGPFGDRPRLIPDVALRPRSDTIGILHRARQAAKVLFNLRRLPRPHTLEEQVFAEVVRDGDICFDIGANVGWIALFLARTAGVAGKVVAFEPVWPTYMTMCANIQNTINVKAPIFTVPFGLAEREKTAIIYVPDGRFEFGSLARPDELAQVFPEMKIARYECLFMSLDVFMRFNEGLVADFWKIDVEGAEVFVLRGASQQFAEGNRPLIVAEVYAPWEERCGYGPWEFFAPLFGLGYRFLFLCPGGLIEHLPSESAPFPREFEHGYNVLAYVPERHAERIRGLDGCVSGRGRLCAWPAAFIRIAPCRDRYRRACLPLVHDPGRAPARLISESSPWDWRRAFGRPRRNGCDSGRTCRTG